MAFPLINIRFILLISASFIAIFSSIAIYFCLPLLISHVIRTQITLSVSSGSFNQWRSNSVVDQIYLYNITNLNDLFAPETSSIETTTFAKKTRRRPIPKLSEIGPFTYKQLREKFNINFDIVNETVLYDQLKSWQFLPDLSISKTTQEMSLLSINHINVPLAGATLNPEYAEFVDPVVSENDLKLFLNHSVESLLFEGYYDILMEQAKASGQIDVDRFGWMHNQNNSWTKSIRIFTGPSNATLNKFGLVDEFDHKRQIQIWHNNNTKPGDFRNVKCNQFRLSSAGEFFPPPEHSFISHNHLQVGPQFKSTPLMDKSVNQQSSSNTQKQQSISIFMPDLCRTIRLFYNGSHDHKGLIVDRYIANENTYKYTKSPSQVYGMQQADEQEFMDSNKCYCVYNETSHLLSCPPNGMMDLFHCRKGSPITISFPHFLYSNQDPTLAPYLNLFNIEQIVTSRKDYQFFIDLEATLNVPVNVQIVFQFNVHLRNDPQLNFTKEYSFLMEDPKNNSKLFSDFYLPQMWIKSAAEIDDANLNNLKFIQKHLALVTPLTTILIFGCASILLMASAKLAFDLTYGPKSRKSLSCDDESSSSNQTNMCSAYLNDKKKFLSMQLLSSNDESLVNNAKGTCCQKLSPCLKDHKIHLRLPFTSGDKDLKRHDCASNGNRFANDQPTTSKRAASICELSTAPASSAAAIRLALRPNICKDGTANQSEESQPLNK